MTKPGADMEDKPEVAMTPEEFSLETRFVILNFMGLVPTSSLGERVPLGRSWQSSSSGSHRSVSLHSRSSSSSSQILPEFTDEQLPRAAAAAAAAATRGADVDLKKPLAKSKSLPKEESLPEQCLSKTPSGGATGMRASKSAIKKQLKKAKSFSIGEPSTASVQQWGSGPQRCLVRGERVEEEFEPLDMNAVSTGELMHPSPSVEASGASGVDIPSSTPTDQNKLFDITHGLSLSHLDTLDTSTFEGMTTPVVSRGRSRDYLVHDSALQTDFPQEEISDLGTDSKEASELHLPRDNIRYVALRGRSDSPCRPTTLDLNAPKSPGTPSWKELVRSPAEFPEEQQDVDQVDSSRSRGETTPKRSPPRLGGQEDGAGASSEPGPSSVSAHGETDPGTLNPRLPPLRQSSHVSSVSSSLPSPLSMLGESGRSWVSSRTSLSDLNMVDVAALVNSNVLPAVALPLREELGEQWKELEQTYEQAVQTDQVRDILSPSPSTQSPESEVARRLGVIGDQVQEEYGEAIERAINGVMSLPRERITYDVFLGALLSAGLRRAQIEGWKQVALVLLFSQRLALALLQKGERHLRDLVDLTARAINDRAAGFILDQGGWQTLSELELDSPVSISDIATHLVTEPDGRPLTDISETDGAAPDPAAAADTASRYTGPGSVSRTPPVSDHDTPLSSTDTVMSASPSDENSNKPLRKGDPREPEPAAVNHHETGPAASSDQLTPEEKKSIEEAVTSVRHEIQLIRQVSSDLHNELDIGRPDQQPTWHKAAALALLATLGVAILVAVRYQKNR